MKTYTIGVDLGGTNTALALVSDDGKIVGKDSFPTATSTVEDWADTLKERIEEILLKSSITGKIRGIGIGAPCANAITGQIEAATDLPWPSPIPLVELIGSRTGLPVTVSNDANAAAIGEMTYGVAKGMDNFIVLTLGTGVGSGIVCDGHLLTGKRGFAGELGHVTFPFASDRACGCGRNGCLQTVASSKGIAETTKRILAEDDEPSMLRMIAGGAPGAKEVAMAAELGDAKAKKIYEFTGECIGRACAEFAAFTDPEAIILFGGVAKAGELLLGPIRKSFAEHALFLYSDNVKFLQSGLPDADAAILGAASLPYLV